MGILNLFNPKLMRELVKGHPDEKLSYDELFYIANQGFEEMESGYKEALEGGEYLLAVTYVSPIIRLAIIMFACSIEYPDKSHLVVRSEYFEKYKYEKFSNWFKSNYLSKAYEFSEGIKRKDFYDLYDYFVNIGLAFALKDDHMTEELLRFAPDDIEFVHDEILYSILELMKSK
jgi:hypothetical protein